MHLQENTLFDHWLWGQGHMKCCPVPSTSCDLCSYKVWSCKGQRFRRSYNYKKPPVHTQVRKHIQMDGQRDQLWYKKTSFFLNKNIVHRCQKALWSKGLIVLQQSSKKWASFRDGGPHRVTSSNMHQIKAKSLPNKKMHDATLVCRGVKFYESLKKGTHTNK